MVIGGQAVLLYGELRLTRDSDIILGKSTSDLLEVIEVVTNLSLEILVKELPKVGIGDSKPNG